LLKFDKSFDFQELEDFYLPYKKKKKTKASVKTVRTLPKLIMAQGKDDVDFLSTKYLNENVINEQRLLCKAQDIVAEWINENIYVRKQLASFVRA
jgi:uncharacterized protein